MFIGRALNAVAGRAVKSAAPLVLTLALVLTQGSANASGSKPEARSLQDTAWVLFQVRDGDGNPVAPFMESPDRARTIVPLLFRAGYLEFSTACRRLVAPYRQQGEQLVIAQAYASLGDCEDDGAFASVVERLKGGFSVSFAPIAQMAKPALHLKSPGGDEFLLYDNGELRFTDPKDVLPQPVVLYLQIGPDTMGCGYNGPHIPGRAENTCVTARRVKQHADGAWHAEAAPSPVMPLIRGFNAPAGSRSIVRVLRYELAHPGIHASRYRDVLDLVIEQHLPEVSSAEYQNPANHWIP